jgi:uncharacterized delta-60 repeat protein
VKTRFRTAALSFCLMFCLIFAASSALAQAGSLDPTFGTGGIVKTDFGANDNNFQFFDTALAPNGDIVVAGLVFNLNNGDEETCVLVRYLPSGALDPSFGTGGVVTLSASSFAESNVSTSGILAVQSNGKILVLTEPEISGTFVIALQRLNTNGEPDPTFGTGGLVVVNIPVVAPYSANPSLVLAQPDGKILIAGTATPPNKEGLPQLTVLGRYLSNGVPDTTFGSGGFTSVLAIGTPTTLGLLSGDGIMALNDLGQLAQFTSAGALLPTPTGGTVIALTQSLQTFPSTFQPNGEYLVESGTQGPFGSRNILATISRFLVSGFVDPSFSSPEISYGPDVPVVASGVSGFAVDSTGRIIIGGSFASIAGRVAVSSVFGLARVKTNGSLVMGQFQFPQGRFSIRDCGIMLA